MTRIITFLTPFLALVISGVHAADKPLKVFILAGQSNMVGWGDSLKLPDESEERQRACADVREWQVATAQTV